MAKRLKQQIIFVDETAAKEFALTKTAKMLDATSANDLITTYGTYRDQASTADQRADWAAEIQKLQDYLISPDFLNGDIPLGIDDVFRELVEWRAAFFALQNVDISGDPFTKNVFLAQWVAGGTYAAFCLFGKLAGGGSDENSLRQLWPQVVSYIVKSGLCDQAEADALSVELTLDKGKGHFRTAGSKAMMYRNHVIAHNIRHPTIQWSDIDSSMEILARAWSLITMWCSLGLFRPFRDTDVAFSGLEKFCTANELSQLKRYRQSYIDQFEHWCTTDYLTKKKNGNRSPFVSLSITLSITTDPSVNPV